MTHDSDYGFIQVFIDYLRQILEMIMDFFNGMGKKEEDPAETPEA